MTYPYQGHQYTYDPRWPSRHPQQQYTAPIYPQQVYSYPQYSQHPHPQQSVPFPGQHNPSPASPRQYAPQYYATPPRYPQTQVRVDRGRDYLSSLTTSISNLELGTQAQAGPSRLSTLDKPLPQLPPPPIPARPTSLPSYSSQIPPLPTPPSVQQHPRLPVNPAAPQQSKTTNPIQPATPPRKSFTPSFHPHDSTTQIDLLRPPDVHRPYSAPQIPSTTKARKKGKSKEEVLDLTLDSSDDELWESFNDNATVGTKKTSPRHRRAASDLPHTPASKAKSPSEPPASPASPNAVRCSGYTRAGQPCKRVVKSTAPFLLTRDTNLGDIGRGEERYCKDHAGMICQVGGFYWRGSGQNVWIDFSGKSLSSVADSRGKS